MLTLPALPAGAPASVSLLKYQTAPRQQLDRNTCWAFAAVAAIEARYLRDYGVTLDLSEEYLFHSLKAAEYLPSFVANPSFETSSSLWGFQGNATSAGQTNRFRLPLEVYSGYRAQSEYVEVLGKISGTGGLASSANTQVADASATQPAMDAFEWSSDVHPTEAQYQARYGATGVTPLTSLAIPELEAKLRTNQEIIGVFESRMASRQASGIVDYNGAPAGGQHVMVIVGYDRTKQLFDIKDSATGAFEKYTYNLVSHALASAAVLKGVIPPTTQPISHTKWLGSWRLSYGAIQGKLVLRRHASVRGTNGIEIVDAGGATPSLDNVRVPMGSFNADGNASWVPVFGTFTNSGTQLTLEIGSDVIAVAVPKNVAAGTAWRSGTSLGPATLTRAEYWSTVPGKAVAMAAGRSADEAWVLGTQATQGGYQIFQRANGTWNLVEGGATRIAVEQSSGTAWVVSNDGQVFERGTSGWNVRPGVRACDIAAGKSRAEVFVLGCGANATKQGLFQLNTATGAWTSLDTGAFRSFAVSPKTGALFTVDAAGALTKWTPGTAVAPSASNWTRTSVPGCAQTVSVTTRASSRDELWISGCGTGFVAASLPNATPGPQFFRSTVNGGWELVPGTGIALAVSGDASTRWSLSPSNDILRRVAPYAD